MAQDSEGFWGNRLSKKKVTWSSHGKRNRKCMLPTLRDHEALRKKRKKIFEPVQIGKPDWTQS